MNPVNTRKTSLVDIPKKHDATDQLDIKRYEDALAKLIKGADTPLTIALQGEWGSGKTSLMNTLRYRLADESSEECCFYHVWVNTWEYSLMGQADDAIGRILRSIILQIAQVAPEENRPLAERALGYFCTVKKTVGTALQVGINVLAKSAAGIDNLTGQGQKPAGAADDDGKPESEISKAKEEIRKMLQTCMTASGSTKRGFLFFIDDLDRIDPPAAVHVLELLKNIFDLENCIFILAIDYDVVIKGLKPKFGEYTQANEREFRSFFDKIIQLPFSMPVSNYRIDTFLVDSLANIGFLNREEADRTELAQTLSNFATASVGTNPRSLKRLVNILSLLQLLSDEDSPTGEAQKRVDFAVVCIQISYPAIYNQLSANPDFSKWDSHLQKKLGLPDLSPEENIVFEKYSQSELFNDEWEKILYQMCQSDNYLKIRVFQISEILNGILASISSADNLVDLMRNALRSSSVTNVQSKSQDAQKSEQFHMSSELKKLNNKLLPAMNSLIIGSGFNEVVLTNGRIQTWLYYQALSDSSHAYRCKLHFWFNSDNLYEVHIVAYDDLQLGEIQSSNFYNELVRVGIDKDKFERAKDQFERLTVGVTDFQPSFEITFPRENNTDGDRFVLELDQYFLLATLDDIASDKFISVLAAFFLELFKAMRNMRLLFPQPDAQ